MSMRHRVGGLRPSYGLDQWPRTMRSSERKFDSGFQAYLYWIRPIPHGHIERDGMFYGGTGFQHTRQNSAARRL